MTNQDGDGAEVVMFPKAKPLFSDADVALQKKKNMIDDRAGLLRAQLSDVMPDWKAEQITAATVELIEAFVHVPEPADSAPKSDDPTLEPPKVG